ncbi:MAG: ComF family protein [Ignavibacteriae bacterium]|nr:ComF family protein [Ignavibacteriota bacterium]
MLDGESRVCSTCWNSFRKVDHGDPTWLEFKAKFEREGVVNDFLSCFLFEKDGKLQDVIHHLKYSGMKSLGMQLGKEIGTRINSYLEFSSADYLIPVPLHKLKQRERGYNQSEYLCKGIAEVTRIPMNTGLLTRKKYTESQTQLNFEQRQENVGDAFEIHPKRQSDIQGRKFILVDDVITTGSTINACAKELIDHGAKTVLVASTALAH